VREQLEEMAGDERLDPGAARCAPMSNRSDWM
jgi:hypothetical protein